MPKEKESSLQITTESPLRWPDAWPRTLIRDRINRSAWKKPMDYYVRAIAKELSVMGVKSATLTSNGSDPRDPGVALWYSLSVGEDLSWQTGLHLDTPVPTIAEIDKAYQELALKHHPDRGGDVEIFKKLNGYRAAAKAYVLGTNAPRLEHSLPLDVFSDAKQNLAGLRLALNLLRRLKALGMPTIVQRIMSTTFKTALPAHASSEERHGDKAVNA